MINFLILLIYTIFVVKVTKHVYIAKRWHIRPVYLKFEDGSWVFMFIRILIVSDLLKVTKNMGA